VTHGTDELERTSVLAADYLPGFEVQGVVGAGGFGTILSARQLKLDRVVAVKVIDIDRLPNPALAERFEAEAVTLGRFHHPNIVPVFDYGRHGGRLYIVMELLEGEDLGRRLKRLGKLDERAAWTIARQAASALAHAATHGVVHRDIKPSNLFLIPAPTGIGLPRDLPMVKVTDFGLALTRRCATERVPPGELLGTPLYMAPEQCRGDPGLDHRADIYALGATVFHALAGRPPFDGSTPWDVVAQKLDHTPTFWPKVSPDSIALLAEMMATEPANRVGTYDELIERIESLPALREPLRVVARPRRRRAAAVLVGGVLLAAVPARFGMLSWNSRAGDDVSRYVSGNYHEALFGGETMAGWRPPPAGGAWRLDSDDDSATVLTGTGFLRRSFAPLDHYRVTLGLDVFRATAAEVHFAIPVKWPDRARRLVLRVTRAAGAELGARDGDTGDFVPLAPALPYPFPGWFHGRRPYLEVRIERAGPDWAAWFNGRPAGRVPDDGTPKSAEVRFSADGGPARIDSVVLEKLESGSP